MERERQQNDGLVNGYGRWVLVDEGFRDVAGEG